MYFTVYMSQPDTVKVELEIPANVVTALSKIGSHLGIDYKKLAVWLIEWQLAVETDAFFANLVDEKIDGFLEENCWDQETLEHLQAARARHREIPCGCCRKQRGHERVHGTCTSQRISHW